MDELGGRLAEAHAQGTPQQLQEAEKRAKAAQAACARKVSDQRNKTQSTASMTLYTFPQYRHAHLLCESPLCCTPSMKNLQTGCFFSL